jgi:hypothetical protein
MISKIPAIVLSYDRNRAITDHMIDCYRHLWPDNPFVFHIPYQQLWGNSKNRVLIKSPEAIKASVLLLIKNMDDDDWVYWCIDDKYPIKLDIKIMEVICEWITKGSNPNVSGILLCRARNLLLSKNLTGERIELFGHSFLERKNYHQIWIHQFLRAKVIRSMFKNFPDIISKAGDMDAFKNAQTKDSNHKIYVIEKNRAVFGESTINNKITKNCLLSMKNRKIDIPEWFKEAHSKVVIIGEDNF